MSADLVIESDTTFANHQGIVPMLWAFCTLAVLELGVVHLLVALKWPTLAWLLTGLTSP